MECEICGKREAVCLVYLEGAKLNCCGSCAHGGKIHYFFSEPGPAAAAPSTNRKGEEEIAEGYGKKIKAARERMGLSLEELGLKIAEKANYLDHVEHEKSFPSIELARKLEKFLKIKLVESESAPGPAEKAQAGKKELTLLDIAEIEKKK